MESYNSQPQTKYARLKNTIFTTLLQGDTGRELLKATFNEIFASVLTGRRLSDIGVNPYGLFSIKIEDIDTGRTFDLDAMSSGEKNLILTYVLMARTSADGGMILLDEPELHLNPAITKSLFVLYIEKLAIARNIQMILCSHSAEILATAQDRGDCVLFHLRSSTSITEVRLKDQEEASLALRQLGTSQIETLLYRRTIFTEGSTDVELLVSGFSDDLARIKVRDLGGRRGIEFEIRRLQDAEANGEEVPPVSFIFDHDLEPTNLASTDGVRVAQWGRRCIENYLINFDVLMDLLKDREFATEPAATIGDMRNTLKRLALNQIQSLAIAETYRAMGYPDLRHISNATISETLEDTAVRIFARLQVAKDNLDGLEVAIWSKAFIAQVENLSLTMHTSWDSKWTVYCDGKQLFADIQAHFKLRVSPLRFKRRIMQELRLRRSPEWLEMQEIIAPIIAIA